MVYTFGGQVNVKKIDVVAAYAAGLFDGEGSVKLHRRRVNGREYFYPRVTLPNTEIRFLEFLHEHFQGGVSPMAKEAEQHKQGWRWECNCQLALAFLARVIPFMLDRKKVKRAKLLAGFYRIPVHGRAAFAEKFNAIK